MLAGTCRLRTEVTLFKTYIMKAKITIELHIESDVDFSTEDSGLEGRLDQVLSDFQDDEEAMDFQNDNDEDVAVKVTKFFVDNIEMTGV